MNDPYDYVDGYILRAFKRSMVVSIKSLSPETDSLFVCFMPNKTLKNTIG